MKLTQWLRTLRAGSIRQSSGKRLATKQVSFPLILESLEARLTPAGGATSTNAWPHPELITVSFVPDGTNFGGQTSNLQATFNTKFGTAATWQNVFKQAAQVWAQQTNVNFNFIADSGAATGTGSYQQGDSTFGDIRIGGYNFGTTALAQAYMPPPVNNYSVAGDIAFNTSQTFNIGSAYDLFTVAAHEFGHALGLNHGAIASMMASAYPGTLTALQTDDITNIRTVYSGSVARASDVYDAATANDTFATATTVTSSISTSTKAGVINNLDLSTSADADWYKFVLPSGSATTLKVKAIATGLSMLDPKIEIYNSSNVLKATGNGGAYGSTASATYTGVAAAQTWYVKVYSADAKAAFKTGKYSLVLNMGTGADPAVTLPNTQTVNGTPLTSGGGVAVTDGVETLVNVTSTSFSQGKSNSMSVVEGGAITAVTKSAPAVARDGSGNYVLVWQSVGQDGDLGGIYGLRYNAFGVAQGSEFKINTTVVGDQVTPAVAMRSNGDFVVTWASNGQDGSGWGIFAQRFSAAGALLGAEFKVNGTTTGDQITPSIGMDGAGNFTIAWSSYGQAATNSWDIYAQRYNASGTVLTSEFLVNTTTAGDQVHPIVVINSTPTAITVPNFEIAWSSFNQDAGSSWGVYAQRYNNSGVAQLSEFQINSTTAGNQRLTGAAIDLKGNFIPVWTSEGQDGDLGGIFAAKFDGNGKVVNSEFRVNTTTVGDQTNASVTCDKYANFYVVWQSYNQASSTSGWDIYGQQFSPTAAPIESEFLVNSTTTGDQLNPVTKMDSQGHLVVAWNGNGVGDSDGVFLQRYSVNTSLEKAPVGDAWEQSNASNDKHERKVAENDRQLTLARSLLGSLAERHPVTLQTTEANHPTSTSNHASDFGAIIDGLRSHQDPFEFNSLLTANVVTRASSHDDFFVQLVQRDGLSLPLIDLLKRSSS